MARTKRIDAATNWRVVADFVVDFDVLAGATPPAASAYVDGANLCEESSQLLNLIGDTPTGNKVGNTRGTYSPSALRYLHRGCVDRGGEDSTSDGEELSGEHSCKGEDKEGRAFKELETHRGVRATSARVSSPSSPYI